MINRIEVSRAVFAAAIGAIALLACGELVQAALPAHASSKPSSPSSNGTNGPVTINGGCVITGGQSGTNNCTTNNNRKIHKEYFYLPRNEGRLNPANEPLHYGDCEIPKGALIVDFGSNITASTASPATILTISGVPVLQVERENNILLITILRIFDDRENIIVRLDKNGFWIEPNTRFEHPDRSTLVVYDHLDNQVLKLRFNNANAITVRGIFRVPGHPTVMAMDDKTVFPGGGAFSHSCLEGGAAAIGVN